MIVPSRDGKNGGGTGIIFDDNGAALGRTPYNEWQFRSPSSSTQIESYGRVFRLLAAHVPVPIEMNVETKFTGDHEHGFDTVAEIPGTDPKLKDEFVMVGGHLDSWIAGTGATDNGAGTIVAMEVMRILNLKVKPRRTIRIALWSGEEEGLFGSKGYAKLHFGSSPLSTAPDQMELPEFMRRPRAARTKARAETRLRLLQRRQWHRQNSRHLHAGKSRRRAHLCAMDGAAEGPRRNHHHHAQHRRHRPPIFDAVGIPGFQFIQDPLDYESRTHHSNMDTYERLQPADLKQIAVVEAIFVYNAAMREQMMPRKPLPHPELLEQQNKAAPQVSTPRLSPDAGKGLGDKINEQVLAGVWMQFQTARP